MTQKHENLIKRNKGIKSKSFILFVKRGEGVFFTVLVDLEPVIYNDVIPLFILLISSLLSKVTNFDNLTNMFIGLGLMIIIVILLLLRVGKAIKIKFSGK